MHWLRKGFTMTLPARRIIAAAAMVAGAFTAVLATPLPAQAVPIDGQVAVLHNVNSHLCLAIGQASTLKGAKAIQWNCEPNNPEQQWKLVKLPSGAFQIRNVNSKMCLAIGEADTDPGAAVIQWPCNTTTMIPGDEQWWDFALHGTSYTITNDNSDLVLAIGQASSLPGATAIQWPYESGHTEQMWTGPQDIGCHCS